MIIDEPSNLADVGSLICHTHICNGLMEVDSAGARKEHAISS